MSLSLISASSPAAAQAPGEWKEDWRVECSLLYRLSLEAGLTAVAARVNPALVESVDDIVDMNCDDSVPLSETNLVRREFRGSAHWLRQLGFQAPIVEAADPERYLAVIDIADFLLDPADFGRPTFELVDEFLNQLAGGGGKVIIHPNALYYLVGGDIILRPNLGPIFLWQAVEVHELFHGVQNATDPVRFDQQRPGDKWIWEGTARAVDNAWSLKPGTPKLRKLERRRFDQSLDQLSYGASLFWLDVGRQLRAEDWVGYLPHVLSTVASERGAFAGVDRALRELFAGRGGEEGGLHRAFPEFVRYALADPREAYQFFLPRPVELEIGPGQPEDHDPVPDRIARVAANAYMVSVTVPDGELAGFRIELEPNDERLHLIVDRTRYDRPSDARPDRGRNAFSTAITGTGAPQQFYVRVANVAREPAGNDDVDVTVKFTLTEVTRCDPETMMASIHPRARDMLMRGAVAGLPSPSAAQVRGLLPAERYEAEHEPLPGLHPARGWMSISGLVSDRGVACTEPLGTNPMLGFQMGGADAQDSRERLRGAMERMMRLSPEELVEAMRAVSPDSSFTVMEQLFPGVPGERMRRPIGFIMESMGRDSDALLSLYSPHGVAWQIGPSFHVMPGPGWLMFKHAGAGRWAPNAGAGLTLRLPGVTPRELREGSTYAAELVAVQTRHGAPIYSRWSGTESFVTCDAAQIGGLAAGEVEFPLLDGWVESVSAESLRGQVTISRFTGASVEGSFSLVGTGRAEREEYRISWGGPCPTARSSGPRARTGDLSIAGTFVAPMAVETQRHGRAVALTYAESREVEEDDGDITPLPAIYPPGLEEEEEERWPWPPPWPVDCAVGDMTLTVVEDWHVVTTESGERVERRTVRGEREVLQRARFGGKPCPPPEIIQEERPIPDGPVDCRAGPVIETVLEDWHVVTTESGERVERRTVRREREVLEPARNGGRPCPPPEIIEEERPVPPDDEPVDCVVGDRTMTVLEDWHVVVIDGQPIERRTVRYEWEILVEPRNGGRPCPPGRTETETRPIPPPDPGTDPGMPAGTDVERTPAPVGEAEPRDPGRGRTVLRRGLTLEFLDEGEGDLLSRPQGVVGEAGPLRVSVTSGRFALGMALAEDEVAGCGFPSEVRMGLRALAAGSLLQGQLRLDVETGQLELELNSDDGVILVRGGKAGTVALASDGPFVVRGDVTRGDFELTLDRKRYACRGIMDFSFTLRGAP